jgi:VanZ family protein
MNRFGSLRRWMWLSAVLYSVAIVYLSSKTSPPVPEAIFRINDKVLHFVQYALFGFLWRGAFAQGFSRSADIRWTFKTTMLLGLLFAAADEFHQSFVPRRDPDVMDFLADTAGLAAGAWASGRWLIPRMKFFTTDHTDEHG